MAGHARDLRCTDRARDLRWDLRRVAKRSQLGEPDPVGEAVEQTVGSLEHQPGLAGPARADEGDQPMASEEAGDFLELALTADEAGQLDRQVRATCAQRAERRELDREGRRTTTW